MEAMKAFLARPDIPVFVGIAVSVVVYQYLTFPGNLLTRVLQAISTELRHDRALAFKMTEHVKKMTYLSVESAAILYICRDGEYNLLRFWPWEDTYRRGVEAWILGWPHNDAPPEVDYVFALALMYSICSTLSFFSNPEKKNDHWIMVAHHIATILLMSCAYYYTYWRSVLTVLVIHAIPDVYLQFCKIIHWAITFSWVCNTFLPPLMYPLLVGMWFYMRVWMLSTVAYVVWTSDGIRAVAAGQKLTFYGMYALFLTLVSLHIYWFAMILELGWTKLKGKAWIDPRDTGKKTTEKSFRIYGTQLKAD